MLVHHILEKSAQKTPDAKAIWYCNQWKTYEAIESQANSVANYLIKNGIQKGDRIALLYENSFDYVINYYAILKAGAVVVSLNTGFNAEMLAYAINDSQAKAIITNDKFTKQIIPTLKEPSPISLAIISSKSGDKINEFNFPKTSLEEIYQSEKTTKPDVRKIDIDIAALVYTSGSTGKPKGVTLTHLNIISNTRSIISYLKLTSDDRIMVVLPFYYIYGKSLLNTHFYVGGSVVIDNRFTFPAVILKTMKETAVTGFAGVPSTFIILLNQSPIRDYTFNQLRYITQAGGSMAVPIQKEVAEVFAPAKLFIMYGATEASARLSYLEPDMLPSKWGSIGKAIPNVDLFVADNNGQQLPSETEGEIVARGSNIMVGYWNDPDETNKVLKNGLYFTGDLGKSDRDGYLYVVGRKKDMIKVGGERIGAKEIEEKILELSEVQEVAAIGIPDSVLGEAVKLFIVPKNGANFTEEDFRLLIIVFPKTKQVKS
jgi:long-chain acyl-CoA synthetase